MNQGTRRRYLLVGFAGGIGTLCRYGVSEWLHAPWLPLATLIINFSGSFLIGALQALSEPGSRFYLGPNTRLALMTGFCGGYTTFSTFSALSFRSIYDGDWNDALLNIIGSLVLGLAAVFAGYFVSTITGKLMETWAHRLQRRRKKW